METLVSLATEVDVRRPKWDGRGARGGERGGNCKRGTDDDDIDGETKVHMAAKEPVVARVTMEAQCELRRAGDTFLAVAVGPELLAAAGTEGVEAAAAICRSRSSTLPPWSSEP